MEWTMDVAGPCDVGKCGEVTIDISEANACTTTTGVVFFRPHAEDCRQIFCIRYWTQIASDC